MSDRSKKDWIAQLRNVEIPEDLPSNNEEQVRRDEETKALEKAESLRRKQAEKEKESSLAFRKSFSFYDAEVSFIKATRLAMEQMGMETNGSIVLRVILRKAMESGEISDHDLKRLFKETQESDKRRSIHKKKKR